MNVRHGGDERGGRILSINGHGLFLRTDLALEVRERIGLTIELPDGPLQAIAIVRVVVDSGGRGIGVELKALADADSRRWRRHYGLELRRLGIQRSLHDEAYL